ncbi:hypothetical protein ACJX0J_039465, partial [Zea mays]
MSSNKYILARLTPDDDFESDSNQQGIPTFYNTRQIWLLIKYVRIVILQYFLIPFELVILWTQYFGPLIQWIALIPFELVIVGTVNLMNCMEVKNIVSGENFALGSREEDDQWTIGLFREEFDIDFVQVGDLRDLGMFLHLKSRTDMKEGYIPTYRSCKDAATVGRRRLLHSNNHNNETSLLKPVEVARLVVYGRLPTDIIIYVLFN